MAGGRFSLRVTAVNYAGSEIRGLLALAMYCDDSDLCFARSGASCIFYVFTTVHGDQSAVAFPPSFL